MLTDRHDAWADGIDGLGPVRPSGAGTARLRSPSRAARPGPAPREPSSSSEGSR